MAARFYFDTSIWLDFLEKRDAHGEIAEKLINKIIEDKQIIIYSFIIIKELENLGYSAYEISEMFSIAKPDNLKFANVTKLQIEEAKKVASERNIPSGDVFHAILARDNEAQLITRDYDFQKIKEITIPRLPEDFI